VLIGGKKNAVKIQRAKKPDKPSFEALPGL
jgi:hypothetical protein